MSDVYGKAGGVFSGPDLIELARAERVVPCDNFSEDHINEASVDVTITGECYEVRFPVMPRQTLSQVHGGETVRSLLPMMGATRHDLSDPWRVGSTYLAKASMDLNFPPGLYGYFNAKSTSGRLFLFVRTFVDGVSGFDVGDLRHRGLSGEVWLVIQPLAFDVYPSMVECYSQLRVFDDDTRFRDRDLRDLLLSHDLLYRRKNGVAYKQGELGLFTHEGSALCTLFAKGEDPIGYVTKPIEETKPIDLSSRDLDPLEYFDLLYATQMIPGDDSSWGLVQEANRFVLVSTNEIISFPEYCAAELKPLARRNGEVITHYAGFMDPGFRGTVVLEMHAPRTVFLRHKQPIAEFLFERMRSNGGSYNKRGTYANQIKTRLPKQFK
jgi:dCTP deaminase